MSWLDPCWTKERAQCSAWHLRFCSAVWPWRPARWHRACRPKARTAAIDSSAFRTVLSGSTAGLVSLCSRHAVGWACEGIPENPATLETELTRLRSENDALKKELLAHGLDVPPSSAPAPPRAQGGDRDLKLPSDA